MSFRRTLTLFTVMSIAATPLLAVNLPRLPETPILDKREGVTVTWNNCPLVFTGYPIFVDELVFNPDPVLPGHALSISGSGHGFNEVDLSGAAVNITAYSGDYETLIYQLPTVQIGAGVIVESGTAPQVAFTFTDSVQIPNFQLPAGSGEIQVQAAGFTSALAHLFCVDLTLSW